MFLIVISKRGSWQQKKKSTFQNPSLWQQNRRTHGLGAEGGGGGGVGGGGDFSHIVCLLARCYGLNGFWTWEVWRHEHLCDSPAPHTAQMPGCLSPGLTLRHSLGGGEEKESVTEKGKYPGSCQCGVRGQRLGVEEGMSGVKWSRQACGGLVKCPTCRPAHL